ncbi:Mut7-C RNAse domain-containing protein [Chloroflexota bacterium]
MSISFIADAMLGTLAKWLRILGFDTLYDPALDDNQIARLARADGRMLLTRDRELARRRGLCSLLIAGQDLGSQLDQVLSDLDLTPDCTFSRCPVCNELLAPLSPEAAGQRVPAYVARSHRTFKLCPACQRIYWRGTHWQRMEKQMAELGTCSGLLGSSPAPDEIMI